LLVSLALATHIPFSAWADEDDATIATALQLLDEAHEEIEEG
jgi:hypothetical protein